MNEREIIRKLMSESIAIKNEGVIQRKQYNTKYGPFVIETQKIKRRSTDPITHRSNGWKEVKSTNGYFADFKDAIEFWVVNDHGQLSVTSSQGKDVNSLVSAVGAKSYTDLLDAVYPITVDCFRDYYDNPEIN